MGALTVLFLAATIFGASIEPARAADPAPGSKSPAQPPASQTPQLAPPAPPSKIDPGIQKQPDITGSPEAVVPPPVVDPNMVVDPEKPRPGDTRPSPRPAPSPAPKK
ncbi:MAG: hypothetical protein K0S58_1894 [Nitrospira sp.]|jgi:hypothetical protein|nr:hypothetical protein [Nitrospira sp.]